MSARWRKAVEDGAWRATGSMPSRGHWPRPAHAVASSSCSARCASRECSSDRTTARRSRVANATGSTAGTSSSTRSPSGATSGDRISATSHTARPVYPPAGWGDCRAGQCRDGRPAGDAGAADNSEWGTRRVPQLWEGSDLRTCLVRGNQNSSDGPGIYNGGTLILTDCTVQNTPSDSLRALIMVLCPSKIPTCWPSR